jgi:hypothetical protein
MFYPGDLSQCTLETTSTRPTVGRSLLGLAACLLVVAGVACASARASGARSEPATALDVIVRASANSTPAERHVICPEKALERTICGEAVTVLRFTQQKPRLCAQVWGGSATADIRGYVNGRWVRLHLTRRNSCDIARWNDLLALLGLA